MGNSQEESKKQQQNHKGDDIIQNQNSPIDNKDKDYERQGEQNVNAILQRSEQQCKEQFHDPSVNQTNKEIFNQVVITEQPKMMKVQPKLQYQFHPSISENQQNKMSQESQEPKMMKMFGKKKKQNQDGHIPSKFKFNQNFVDVPINGHQQQYQYSKINLFQITLPELYQKGYQNSINYRVKANIGMVSRKNMDKQKPITEQLVNSLKEALFQKQINQSLPKSWNQGFILSPFKETPYGLKQIEGGPCGIIAVVQCYFLKHFLYCAKIECAGEMQNQLLRENCLMAAITDMLYKNRNQNGKIILGLPPRGYAGSKVDYSGLKIRMVDASTFQTAYESMCTLKSYFIGEKNHGVAILLICVILTKGIDKIRQQVDMPDTPLIGKHGHSTQQLVNLFMTGKASSNCFDGQKILDSQAKLKGIQQKSQFGFLTIFETLKYIEVGRNLKSPIFPFWVICKQFHYHVIFANHYLISQNNDADKFDIVYFDGLHNCGDRLIITMEKFPYGEEPEVSDKKVPLIQQVMMTKWGKRKSDWNGSIPIL